MRHRRWVMVVVCLSVSLLLLAQLSSASDALRVDEAATRILLEESATKISLALINPSGREFAAHVRLELLDPQGALRASGESDETIKGGASALVLKLPLQIHLLDKGERNAVLWYRLRYRISPQASARDATPPIEGIVSLSEITPDIFELRVTAPAHAREGTRYHARVLAVHPVSSRPVPGVKVEAEIVFHVGAKSTALKAEGVTSADGYASLDFDLPNQVSDDNELELRVTGSRDAFVLETESEIEINHEVLMMLSTDKPLYQPGQTLHLRALVFDSTRHALAGAAATLTINDPEGTTVLRAPLQTSRFGIASLDWPISENTRLGDYNLQLKLDDEKYEDSETTQSVKISRYDLPNFAVEVKPDRAFYLPGQNAEVAVRADYLFGQPVRRGHVRVVRETERRWNYREQKWETEEAETYEGDTDADGRYNAPLNLEKEHKDLAGEDDSRYRDLTYAAYFTDPTTNRTEVRRFDLRLTKDAIHIYILEGDEQQTADFPLQFYLSTSYADGTPAECEVEIKDAGVKDGAASGQTLRTIKTNRYGVARVDRLSLPHREEAEKASLNFDARDGKGALGHQANEFEYTNHPVIRLETDKSLYRAGESIKATITASEARMKLIVGVWKGEAELRSQAVELHDGQVRLTIPYSADFDAGVTLLAYAAPDAESGYYYRVPAAARKVIYPRERDLRLNVELSQPSYKPGDDAHADFSVRAPGGQPVESALGVVVFDKAVEERARTDREFGSNYGFYGAYYYLSGYTGEVSGISQGDLFKLDLSKPIPADLKLVAEILLRVGAQAPRIFGSDSYVMSQSYVFARLIEQQMAALKAALAKRYEQSLEYPRDALGLRSMLAADGVDFDHLPDPWGTPYRARFSTESSLDVLGIVSAGADKRFETADDFVAVRLTWPYFRPLGERLNHVLADYQSRTGNFIRDETTLKEALRSAGVGADALRDRWGQPYRFAFDVSGTNYLIHLRSGGPDAKFADQPYWRSDDFTIWTTVTDYFAGLRAQIDTALTDYTRKTGRFPQNEAELRAALSPSKINLDALRDPWGHNYYATFPQDARYSDRRTIESYSKYGEAGKLEQKIKITPVTQQINYIHLRSRGEDEKEGTTDDFSVADFSRLLTEQSAADKQPQTVRPNTIYAGATGAISGLIIDMTAAVIPNVKVTATHLNTSQIYEARSDDEGRYLLRGLPVGLYQVQFTLAGFMTRIVVQVPVHSSNLTSLDAQLEVGGISETVNITTDGGARVDVSSNTTGTNVSSEQFSNFSTLFTVQSLYSIAPTVVRSGLRSGLSQVITKSGSYSAEYGKSAGGVIGVSEQAATPRLRENFSETLLWQPSLETDREGRARIDFKLADNITTWKMAVVGSTVDGEIGLVEREIQAFQPFFVEHDPPRILTEGDEIQLPVVVRNYLDKAQDVNLKIAPAPWFTLLGPAQKQLSVPAGDSSRQTFDFRASASVKDGSQQITANSEGAGDAIVKPVSVHPDGEEMSTTDSQLITQAATLNLNLPANTIKNSARAELKIYPNLMAHVFESIEGILHRPYGCGEQTISSTYPSLLVLKHLRRSNQQSAVEPKALRYLRAGYERLLNYRTAAGGFSYWGGREDADLALTAYALRFLNDAKEFIAVDEDVMSKAREWLISQQRADGGWLARYYSQGDDRPSLLLTAYIARVLAATDAQAAGAENKDTGIAPAPAKPAPPSSLQRALAYLSSRIDEADEPYLIASYALAAHDAGETANAARAVARLRTLAHEENNASYWALETNTPFYGWGLAGRIETTALVVQALARTGQNDDALMNRGLLFLLRQQDRYGVWYSTQATINVLDALTTLLNVERSRTGAGGGLAATGEATAGGPIVVIVNNRRVAEVAMPPEAQPASPIVVDLSSFLAPGENRIELQREGKALPASVQAVAAYYVPWSATPEANHQGAPAGASSALRFKLGFDKSEVKIGDEVTCTVLAERIGHAGYGMMLAEIGLPPGADVDRASLDKALKESNWSLSRYDILPDRLVVYLWPQAGGTSFTFKFRPRYGLTAQTAASQLYDYYNPEARVVVAPTKFIVKKAVSGQ